MRSGLEDQRAARLERTERFNQLCMLAGGYESLDQFLPHALERTLALLGAQSGSLLIRADILDAGADGWVMATAAGLPGWEQLAFPSGIDGSVKLAAEARSLLPIPDVDAFPDFNPRERELLEEWAVGSALGAPLRTRGETIGIIFVNWLEGRGFTQDDGRYFVRALPQIVQGIMSVRAESAPIHEQSRRSAFVRGVLLKSFEHKSMPEVAEAIAATLDAEFTIVTPRRSVLFPRDGASFSEQFWQECGAAAERSTAVLCDGHLVVPVISNGVVIAYVVGPGGEDVEHLLAEAAAMIGEHATTRWEHDYLEAPPAGELLRSVLGGSGGPVDGDTVPDWPVPFRLLVSFFEADDSDRVEVLERVQREVGVAMNTKVTTCFENACVAVVSDRGPSSLAVEAFCARLDSTCGAVRNKLRVVLTRPSSDRAAARDLFDESRQMTSVATGLGLGDVLTPNQLGVYELLVFDGSDSRRRFVEKAVGPLLEYDRVRNSSLAETLETFLDHHCSVTAAAAELFVHPNTVRYRLNRVEQLVGVELDVPDARLAVHLALKLSRHLEPGAPRAEELA